MMKLLRTLPFILAALLVLWVGASGVSSKLLWVLSIFLTVVAWLTSLFGYAESPKNWGVYEVPEHPRLAKRRRAVIGLSLAVMFSTAALQWPLRACFQLSQPALERLALQAQRGSIATPQSVGLFAIMVAKFDVEKGRLVLWLDNDNVLIRHAPGKKVWWFNRETTGLDSQWSLYIEM
jgi:hypothetical protein